MRSPSSRWRSTCPPTRRCSCGSGAGFDAAFKLQRALQYDAESLCTAYLAAYHERKTAGPKTVRARLGLDRKGIEDRARAHVERGG